MTGREIPTKLREKASHLTPRVLVEYPFEVVAALVAVCMGLPILVGLTSSAALVALVGTVAFYAWAAALTIGGLTVAVALKVGKEPPSPHGMAAGLSLAGGSFGIYCLAVGAVLGWPGLPIIAAYLGLAVVSFVRANHFRRVIDIQRGARRLQERER